MNLTQTVEWVPVGERLPKEDGKYILAWNVWNMWLEGRFLDGMFTDADFHPYPPDRITHWALPLKHPNEL